MKRVCSRPYCKKIVAKNRNFCDDHRGPCWCPCDCGCEEPDMVLNVSGLCPDCEDGNHEVPPDGVQPGVPELLKQHESIVEQYRKILEEQKA